MDDEDKGSPVKFARTILALLVMVLAFSGCTEPAGDQAGDASALSTPESEAQTAIRIVGSSTLYPFAVGIAQSLNSKTGTDLIVEATGSGGGHKLFCAGMSMQNPAITSSSRAQKPSERAACAANGVTDVVEIKIGQDGIVLAENLPDQDGPAPMNISLRVLFLALARDVPASDTDCTLRANPYKAWADIDPALPDTRIEVFGPPPTSGTRDAFVDIALQGGAANITCLSVLREEEPMRFARIASRLREDGKWIDAGENDNGIIQELTSNDGSLAIFGYSFLDQNRDKIRGARINGVAPTFESISEDRYPLSRALYFYIKEERLRTDGQLQALAIEMTSEAALAPEGYLADIGLVPLPAEEREANRAEVAAIAEGKF